MECSRMHFFLILRSTISLGYSSSARRLPVEIFFKPSSYLPTDQARRKICSRFSSPYAARAAFLFPADVQPKPSPSSLSPCARISIPSQRAPSAPSPASALPQPHGRVSSFLPALLCVPRAECPGPSARCSSPWPALGPSSALKLPLLALQATGSSSLSSSLLLSMTLGCSYSLPYELASPCSPGQSALRSACPPAWPPSTLAVAPISPAPPASRFLSFCQPAEPYR
jgi:hypothetical protein